jgi:hypothetical protein
MLRNIGWAAALLATSCSTPRSHNVTIQMEAEVPLSIRNASEIFVQETKCLIGMSAYQVTLRFLTTNRVDDAQVDFVANFAKTRDEKSDLHIRLRTGKTYTSYKLIPGSKVCRQLATSLNSPPPTDGVQWFTRMRVEKLKALLRGKYTYKSPPD